MLSVSEIYIYPIKSLGGISLSSAVVTDRGFQYDRRWMLVDETNRFMTQREFPFMALLQPTITTQGLQITHKQKQTQFMIPFVPQTADEIVVQIWDDICLAQLVSEDVDGWFSEMLSFRCRLVYMPDKIKRLVEKPYAKNNEITSFSDAYPFLLVGQSSLDHLNKKLETAVPMNRFRPNIVFTGADAHEEDLFEHFVINGIDFFGAKPCARCPIPTINQETAERAKEPIKTLATYRSKNNKVFFGQNLLHKGNGTIRLNDEIVIKAKTSQLA